MASMNEAAARQHTRGLGIDARLAQGIELKSSLDPGEPIAKGVATSSILCASLPLQAGLQAAIARSDLRAGQVKPHPAAALGRTS
jgi:hypothetical protein